MALPYTTCRTKKGRRDWIIPPAGRATNASAMSKGALSGPSAEFQAVDQADLMQTTTLRNSMCIPVNDPRLVGAHLS
jgi:hypothetical protein